MDKFSLPTEPQTQGWPPILAGKSTLVSAPTGSGKTLAAFLICLDQLIRQSLAGTLSPKTQVLYISPRRVARCLVRLKPSLLMKYTPLQTINVVLI
ncbi:DEAD/DEAH box helicase [Legionella oakridgensis]|uniref:DEAD/DEAH box helicase n=1 Tax=Legionella oakridgensis TaxID=29423 RepID=UPI0023521230|nr:DEAD/DEAH box helicase [Legionella oakridgensis]